MSWTLEKIRQALDETKAPHPADPWNSVREQLWERLVEVGLPRPRSEAYFWIPLSLLQNTPIQASKRPHAPAPSAMVAMWESHVSTESECTAIFPALLATAPRLVECKASADWQDLQILADGDAECIEVRIPAHSKLRIRLQAGNVSASLQRIDFVVAESCEVEVLNLLPQNDAGTVFQHNHIALGAFSTMRWFNLDCGNHLYRNSVEAHLLGEKARFEYRALSILGGDNHSHRRLRVWHSAPGVESEQFIRHVLLGQSNASCDTQVEITRGTKGSKAHQLVNSLLLSEQTKASAKPTLIIHNDDVEASHGTTCGDLDAQQLFYLQSRGLSFVQARRLLLSAFVDTVVQGHPASAMAADLSTMVRQALARRLP